jgi:hypothetical protein
VDEVERAGASLIFHHGLRLIWETVQGIDHAIDLARQRK